MFFKSLYPKIVSSQKSFIALSTLKRFNSTKTLYVGNVPTDVDPIDLRAFFEAKAQIISLRMPLTATGAPRGFAFIEVNDENREKILKEFQNAPLKGHTLRLQDSKTKLLDPQAHQLY
ncbi:hypothetical protein DSO57_1012996 [Entomophthora muscae]|uniref:Uncharacterized protein n=1 Tax=Entomophthora muscae TaxID=34485 RepID=A0ACC2UFM0_9FUNG|nr:hypothetical protein DSO57_1012996 [Entomophthora muscae]